MSALFRIQGHSRGSSVPLKSPYAAFRLQVYLDYALGFSLCPVAAAIRNKYSQVVVGLPIKFNRKSWKNP